MVKDIPEDNIRKLAKILKEEGLTEISVEIDGCQIKVKKDEVRRMLNTSLGDGVMSSGFENSKGSSSSQNLPPIDLNVIEIKSPMVGTYYASSSPDSEVFVRVGSKISVGDTLCIIEAMKLFNELPSEINGEVVELCANNAQAVSFGQVLMKIRKS